MGKSSAITLFFAGLLLAPLPLAAQSTEPAIPDSGLATALALLDEIERCDRERGFEYRAETFVLYGEEGDSLLLRGRPASVIYQQIQLEAAELVYYRREEIVEARALADSAGVLFGLPELRQGDEVLRGERIRYDLRRRQGVVFAGRIHRDKGHYAGRSIRILSTEEFHVRHGSYTTCDYPHPHFDFYSPRIKVLMGEMAIARPVYFRIAEKPIFWIPFYIFSLRQDRQSGILTPTFGRRPLYFGSDQYEWEVRNLGYYFAPSDYWDLTLAGDLRQRSGWLVRLTLAHALRYRWNGRIEAQFENRQEGYRPQRAWRVDLYHNQELSPTAQLRASGTFQSNRTFNRDNSANLRDRLNRTLRSNLSFNQRWPKSGNTFTLNASQTRNLDTQVAELTFPEASFRKARQPLWGRKSQTAEARPWYAQIYYDAGMRLRQTRHTSPADTAESARADLDLRISSQHKPFSYLQLSPSLSETWRDADLRRGAVRGQRTDQFALSAALTQTFYGLFHPRLWQVVAFRHVLKPNLSLNLQATRTDTGGFLGFGGDRGRWKPNRRLDLRLDNTFWAKVQKGEEELKVRLAQLDFATGYDFERANRPLSELTTTFSIAAGQHFDTRLTWRSDFYDDQGELHLFSPRLRQFEARTTLRQAGQTKVQTGKSGALSPFSGEIFGYETGLRDDIQTRGRLFQLSHYYSRTHSTRASLTRSWVRLGIGFSLGQTHYATGQIREKWQVNYAINYDLHAPGRPLFAATRVISELLSLQREFHDWTATLNLEPSRFHRDRAFFFKVQLRDIPQLRFEHGDAHR